jgi:hypothetical protein
MLRILILTDIRPTGIPASPKAVVGSGYRGRICGRNFGSKLKCLRKYDINKDTRVHLSFLF